MNNINREISLEKLGWSEHFEKILRKKTNKGLLPARVIEVNRKGFLINNGTEELRVTAAGNFSVREDGIFPITGDWVLYRDNTIIDVMKRQNSLSRGSAGTRKNQNIKLIKEQFIAANLDRVFIVCGLDRDFNIRRIERYLTLIYNNGLAPVIVLTKGDLHSNPWIFAVKLGAITDEVPLHIVSEGDEDSITALRKYLHPNQTITLIGSSGAGKSTLVNRLAGRDIQLTGSISSSVNKGRHTTTTRSLIKLSDEGMIIDNPGIREITFAGEENGLSNSFPEIEEKSGECRFSNCSHTHEPGCMVIKAVNNREIEPERLESFLKMRKELEYFSQKENTSADKIEKDKWQHVSKKARHIKKNKYRKV